MPEPAVTIAAVHTSDGPNLPVTRIVIHATSPGVLGYPAASEAGRAHSTAEYFTDAGSGGSAHYVCDVAGEEHCVADATIAWHAPPNANSLGVEICAESFYTREQWLSPDVAPALERAANRVAELCSRHQVPAVRLTVDQVKAGQRGLCSHVDVTLAFRQSNHTDPGPGFPWDRFLQLVDRALIHPGTTTPITVTVEETADMPKTVVDPKADAYHDLTPNWEVNDKGEMFAWNGARGLHNVGDFTDFVRHGGKIVDVVLHPSGDGLILFGDDRRHETDEHGQGHDVRSTFTILVGQNP